MKGVARHWFTLKVLEEAYEEATVFVVIVVVSISLSLSSSSLPLS